MSPKDLFPIYLGEIFYKFQRIYFFFGILLTLYFCVCKYCNIYELLGGKWNNSIMFVKLVCTALIYSRLFFSMNGPQTAIDLNNGESFCIQKKMGTLKNRSFKTCHHWWGFQEMKSKTFFSWNQFYHEYFSWKMIGWTTFLNLSSTGICFCF